MKKKTLFPCKVLEAKMVEREDAFKSLPLFKFLAQEKSLIFFARWQMLKCTQGNCILLAWPSSRAFPSSDIALQKNLYFPWNVIETKMYRRKFHFVPRFFIKFSLLQLQYCVKTLPFPLNENRIRSLHFPFNYKGDPLRFSDFQTEDPSQVSCVGWPSTHTGSIVRTQIFI